MISLLTVPLAIAATVFGQRSRTTPLKDESTTLDLDDDLPCPWCHAPTREKDLSCPSCGRRFGFTG